MSDADDGVDDAGEVVEKVGDAVEAGAAAVDAVQDATRGDAAGAVTSGLSAGAGALGVAGAAVGDSEAGEALGVARQVAQVAGGVAQQASSLLGGGGRQGAPGAPSGAEVLSGDAADALMGAASAFSGGHRDVDQELTIEGVDGPWTIHSASMREAAGSIPTCFITATCPPGSMGDETEVFGQPASLVLDRGESRRTFRGVVSSCVVEELRDVQRVRLEIVAGIWMLDQGIDSRIYQELTVPSLVSEVIGELLGAQGYEVREELTESYPTHEYLVQHRESHFAFLTRLMNEEGIWFWFDHEGDHETLVLCDSNDNRPAIANGNDGRVDYVDDWGRAELAGEAAGDMHRVRRLGATDAVVSGFDWTAPALSVRHEATDRGTHAGPAMEVHAHHHAVRHYQYSAGGGSYEAHSADRQGRIHSERLDVARGEWTVETNVLTARPGEVIELTNAGDHEGRYLILISHLSTSLSSEGGRGRVSNHLNVIPLDVPYRPPAPPHRLMPGPETAMVVGPAGEEIHVDEHGRVKVQFHWDRRGQRDEHSSAWIRVAQMWSGPGWGSVFLPRIGTEVIVSYLGGDPDRPVITGCLYNGDHRLPYPLPDDKTKSTIKTNSSPGGGGFNELRFEDKAGSEEVFIHAQKDFNEVVEHDHSTHVKNDQANTVDVNQTEQVGGEQTMTVDKNRTVHVKGSQSFKIDGGEANDGVTGSKLEITGDYKVDVSDWIEVEAPTYIQIKCGDSVIRMEPGKIRLTAGDGSEIVLDANAQTTSSQGTEVLLDADARTTASTGAELKLDATADLHSIDGSQVLLDANAAMTSSKGATVQLSADADMSGMGATVTGEQHADVSAPTVTLAGAAGSVEAAAGGVDVAGPQVNVTGQGAVNISGSVVKIN